LAAFGVVGSYRLRKTFGWPRAPDLGGVVASQLIQVQVGDIEIAVEAVTVAGSQPTASPAKAAEKVRDAFARAQETIVQIAQSTAQMIDRAGTTARPDRVDVEFGLKFSASGGVIMAGVAGEASLKVTLTYDVAAKPATGPLAAPAAGETAPEAAGLPSSAGPFPGQTS
jgi:hypothetical protein